MANNYETKIKTLDQDTQDLKDKIIKLKGGLKSKFFDNSSGDIGNYFSKEINKILSDAGVGIIQ